MTEYIKNSRGEAPELDGLEAVVRGESPMPIDGPATFPLRQAPWRGSVRTDVNPDDFLFGVSAARFRDVLIESTAGLVDPESQLRGLLGATFDFAESDPHAFTTILSMHHSELARASVDPTPLDVFKHVLHDGMQEGVFWQNDLE